MARVYRVYEQDPGARYYTFPPRRVRRSRSGFNINISQGDRVNWSDEDLDDINIRTWPRRNGFFNWFCGNNSRPRVNVYYGGPRRNRSRVIHHVYHHRPDEYTEPLPRLRGIWPGRRCPNQAHCMGCLTCFPDIRQRFGYHRQFGGRYCPLCQRGGDGNPMGAPYDPRPFTPGWFRQQGNRARYPGSAEDRLRTELAQIMTEDHEESFWLAEFGEPAPAYQRVNWEYPNFERRMRRMNHIREILRESEMIDEDLGSEDEF